MKDQSTKSTHERLENVERFYEITTQVHACIIGRLGALVIIVLVVRLSEQEMRLSLRLRFMTVYAMT